jgi:RNA polymerase sigma-70 factor (ECF subfamily)
MLSRGGDGFAQIYADHGRAVYAAALRVVRDRQLAEDVTQDVFLDLWRRPERYDPARGELRAYLRLRARSRALDVGREARARGRLEDRLLRFAPLGAATAPDAATAVAARERWTALADAIRALPEAQRDAVALTHLGGLSASELAVARRIPLGTAKSRVRLGLDKVRANVASVASAPAA